jgi:hypothetical protein
LSINLLSFLVKKLSEGHGRSSEGAVDRDKEPIVNETTLDKLQALLLDQLHVCAQTLELLKQRQLISLLLHWKALEAGEAQRWIASQIETDAGAIAIGENWLGLFEHFLGVS